VNIMQLIKEKTQLTSEQIWQRHKVYQPQNQTEKLGDIGELIELEPGVKVWSNLLGAEKR
jgi:hypothetical protein